MTEIVYKYRIYCNTEGGYKYIWSTGPPTTCPTNDTHFVDSNSAVIIDKLNVNEYAVNNLPLTAFDEVRVAERTSVMELKSMFGKSELRDIYSVEGAGTITNNVGDSEYNLQTTVNGLDKAKLYSRERGRYMAGMQAECGIATRIVGTLTGEQTVKIGLSDGINGLYFKHTSSGTFACVMRDGVENSTHMSQWNTDTFDGTGKSGHILNINDGVIYNIRFTWYGYGGIEFRINTVNTTNTHSSWLGHIYKPYAETSIKNPNLPIVVDLSNGGTNAAAQVFVAGRQYSILGKYSPISRLSSCFTLNKSVNSSVVFSPIINIRRKSSHLGNSIKNYSIDIVPSVDMIIQLRVDTQVTGFNFRTLPNTPSLESCAEYDDSSTAVTGGIVIWTGYMVGSRQSLLSDVNATYNLSETQTMTVCARNVTGTNGSVSAVLRWTEEW